MQIYTGTSLYPQRNAHTLREILDNSSMLYADTDAYIYRKEVQGEDFHVSYRELAQEVKALAAALAQVLGTDFYYGQDRIAVTGENSYPWALTFNATVSYLGVAVPLDPLLPPAEAVQLVQRSSAKVFCYGSKQRETAEAVQAECPDVRLFVSLSADPAEDLPGSLNIWQILDQGLALSKEDQDKALTYCPQPDNLASIVFTSGTTSNAKGVMLSHQNIASNAHACAETFDVNVGDRALSVLPLHHTFENTVGMYCFWFLGMTICINDGLRYIAKNLKTWQIAIMMVVPAIVENLHGQIMRALRKQDKEKQFKDAATLSKFLSFLGADKRRKIFSSVIDQLGGKFKLMVNGGGALDPQLADFFESIGINCLPGYGLTEASPVLSTNHQNHNITSSSGWPMPGVSLRIDQEDLSYDEQGNAIGEILAYGDNIMLGYLDDPEKTQEVITADGWLRTGDLGFFDEEGAIHITGRKKSMIVLSNGEKAFPEEIERLLKAEPGIVQAFVWDEVSRRGNVIICAKVQIDRQTYPLVKHADDEEISHWLSTVVADVNGRMPVYKAISAYIWTEEPLIMTTTLKVKRPAESAKIRDDLAIKGLSIQDASGLRVPATTDLELDLSGVLDQKD